jgi:hypothetical protein
MMAVVFHRLLSHLRVDQGAGVTGPGGMGGGGFG